MKTKLLMTTLTLLLLCKVAYAERAVPVYDVDSLSNDVMQEDDSAEPSASPASSSNSPIVSVVSPAGSSSPSSIEQKIARLEQQLANAQQNSQSQRFMALQGEVQSLRGQVEELSHQLQVLLKQQQILRLEMAKQQASKNPVEPTFNALSQEGGQDVIKTKIARGKLGASAILQAENNNNTQLGAKKLLSQAEKNSSSKQPNIAEEQAVYQKAYSLIKVKKYNEAIGTLQKMLHKYPSGQFAANAHYWLGELYSLTGQHQEATSEFSTVIKLYPGNARIADSQLKLGLIYATELKWAEAKASFNRVIRQFPGTASAQLAMEQLKQLKQAGH